MGRVIRNGPSTKYQLSSLNVGPVCEFCGGNHRTAGPIWSAPIHDVNFVSRLQRTISKGSSLNTSRRIEGILSLISEELPDVPLYIVFDKFLKVLRMPSFKMKEFVSAILNSGYKVSPTHASKNGIKTNAPYSILWSILLARAKAHPINIEHLPENHPARVILSKSISDIVEPHSSLEIDFKIHPDSTFESEKANVLRYQHNPSQFWGPKAKAITSLFHGDLQDKSKRLQNSKKKVKKQKISTSSEINDS